MFQAVLGHTTRQDGEGGPRRACTNAFINNSTRSVCLLLGNLTKQRCIARPFTKPRRAGVRGLLARWVRRLHVNWVRGAGSSEAKERMVQARLDYIPRQIRDGSPGRVCTNGLTNQRMGDFEMFPEATRIGRRSIARPPTKPRRSGVRGLITNRIGGEIVSPFPAPITTLRGFKHPHTDQCQPTSCSAGDRSTSWFPRRPIDEPGSDGTRGLVTEPFANPRRSGTKGLLTNRIGGDSCFPSPHHPGPGTAASSSTSTIANQPLALMEAQMESAAPEGLAEQASWNSQGWEAHRAKLAKYGDWLLMAADNLTFPGNATPCGSAQRCERTTQ